MMSHAISIPHPPIREPISWRREKQHRILDIDSEYMKLSKESCHRATKHCYSAAAMTESPKGYCAAIQPAASGEQEHWLSLAPYALESWFSSLYEFSISAIEKLV